MSDHKTTYKVIVSGVTFTLDRASINSDSPDTNLLALSLLGDFAEAQEREIVLNRNVSSFKIIVDHLQGYRVFPLAAADYQGMDEAKMLRYLQDDSDYYNLKDLAKEVDQEYLD